MSTNTENRVHVPEEHLNDFTLNQNNPQFRTILSSGIITNSNNIPNVISYNANNIVALQNQILLHPTVPSFLSFNKNGEQSSDPIFSGISNAYETAISGITDFTAYNKYIHYDTNINPPITLNIMNNLVRASFRFQMYSRQYRTF